MSARQRALRQPLTEASLAKMFRRLLPRRNNYCAVNYPELLEELRYFGVQTRRALRKLVLRNVREASRIDQEPLDEINAKIYRSELGDGQFVFLERRRIFFGWEGLMRVILELEFGDMYREFAAQRDHSASGNAAQA
jgi:hypothetical protein